MIFLQLPASILIDRLGTRRSTILGNVFNVLFIILIVNSSNLTSLIVAQFFSALCFSLKNISDIALLRYSIPKTEKKGSIFSRLEGKGSKNYYLLNAVTAIAAGFLYVINPYIPVIGSLVFALIGTIISLGFKEIEEVRQIDKVKDKLSAVQKTSEYFKGLKEGMNFIVHSQRLRSLFLYSGIAWGFFTLSTPLRSSILVDIGAPAQVVSIVAAIVGIASAMGAKRQTQFHNKFRNRTLSILLIMVTISLLIVGITGVLKLPYMIALLIITISFVVLNYMKGMDSVLTARYLGNFSNDKIVTQIYAMSEMSKNIFRSIIGVIGSYLLGITNTANAIIIVSIMLGIISVGLISYMKTRVGLKPEEYHKNEIGEK